MRVRYFRSQENAKHVLGIIETSRIRPPVFTNISLVFLFNNSLLSIYYVPGTILDTGDIAVNKTDDASALMKLAF